MNTLARFRKPGGFQQLLALIETCDPIKQKNLLHLIGAEDPGWAHLVKAKALTFERILKWPTEILMELTPHLSDNILAAVFKMAEQIPNSSSEKFHEKWMNGIPSIKAREIREIASFQELNANDQSACLIKLLQTIRELDEKGIIRLASFDPSLEIDARIAS